MKPTEADIQAELIEGWEIADSEVTFMPEYGYFDITKDGMTVIVTGTDTSEINFWWKSRESLMNIKHADFLTGNYDLSAISQHYEPEEWQRIITMCERIVRLITGEQVEQSLEEKVREILEPLSAISDIEVQPDVVTFTAGISKREIVSTGVIDHDALSDSCRHEDFDIYDKEYADAYRKVSALLTAQPESEKTLEEAVRWLLPDCAELIDADCDPIEIRCGEYHLKVSRELIWWRQIAGEVATEWQMCSINKFRELINKDLYDRLPRIAAEISKHQSTRSTKPSYSDLEQLVEELEKLVDEEHRKAKDFHRDSITKSDRITDLEAQLQDYISPADHEREMANCDSLLAKVTLERDQARKDSALHLSWFHREYAKNAEASQ